MTNGVLPDAQVIADDVAVHSDTMLAMRDGIRLATDIYRPAVRAVTDDRPLPVILERTPYGKRERSRSEIEPGDAEPMTRPELALYFVRAGYIVVFQDCRGRYGSEGTFTKYLSEGEDGYDTCAWIVDQPWCNGRVGTMGLSYAAHTQMALACLAAPGLAAMVIDSGGFSNAYREGIRQGGAFELKQATWAFNNARESPEAKRDPVLRAALEGEDIRAWFAAMPWSEGRSPVRAHPEYEAYLLEQWRAGTFDASWRKVGLYAEGFYDKIPSVPIVLMSSWYDVYANTTFTNYAGLNASGTRPLQVIMGPWLHGNRQSTFSGDADFGPSAPISGNLTTSWADFRRRWFDRWLKDRDNGVEAEPTARLFLMGGGSGGRTESGRLDHGGRWIEAPDWPLPQARPTPFFLHGDGRLSEEPPAAGAPPLTYDFDPADPVPTIGGQLTSGHPVFEGGGFDQREAEGFFGCRRIGLPLSARSDVLAFETAPLPEDVAVVGPIRVTLHVASDAPDTDFTAKLIDVYPPSADYPGGYALILSDGIIRCRYRASFERPEPIVPGEVFEVMIEAFPTANLFARGHRIRLDVSSSNFPKFDVNPNTGAPEGTGRARAVARNTVYCDASRASHVVLPLVPTGSLTLHRPAA
jgi:uncharacterized protein